MRVRGQGVWERSKRYMTGHVPMTVAEIAAGIDALNFEVRSALCRAAKAGHVVRVLPIEGGPLKWRLHGAQA
jgi:hypothetical protein